jgi:hypothetical protein
VQYRMKTRICISWIALFACVLCRGEGITEKIHLLEISSVPFVAQTQIGEIDAEFSVCLLQSRHGTDSSLYITVKYSKEYPAYIDRILSHAHSPIVEKIDGKIIVLYTSGANTTWVTIYDITSSLPEFIETKTIAWNDQGHWRKSQDFDQYEDLYRSRKRHNKSEHPPENNL